MSSGQPPCPTPQADPAKRVRLVNAPPSWRCIDFISDLHLHAGRPHTFEAFNRYLAGTPADAVFVLGDLFEAWVGDDMRHQPFEAACTGALSHAGQRLNLFLMSGNRDFLMGAQMVDACHAQWLDDPCVLTAFGQTHLLTHGDAWCVADADYQRFRQDVRAQAWQDRFLSRPLDERLAAAAAMRAASEARKGEMAPESWADVDPQRAADELNIASAQILVHGHTHRPESSAFAAPGAQRHVLSDWDLDDAPKRAEVLRLDPRGYHRLSVDQALATPPLAP